MTTHASKRVRLFTKTWQLRNSGTCAWNVGYTLHFIRGNRMNSRRAVPLAETAPNAHPEPFCRPEKRPPGMGFYRACMKSATRRAKPSPIGLTKSIWVKIMVGSATVADDEPTATTAPGEPQPTGSPHQPTQRPCQPQQSGTGLIDLINNARQDAGLQRRRHAPAPVAATRMREMKAPLV